LLPRGCKKNLCYPIKFAKGEIVYDTDAEEYVKPLIKMEKCIECGGELVSNSEGTFCKACGLEDEEGRFSFIKEYKKVIPDNRSKRFYNSGLSKHKKDLKNSKIDKKTQENLRKAKKNLGLNWRLSPRKG